MIFEGEFLNGKKWNGKGKDYYNDIEFEGEYLNGKRWNGHFKEYEDFSLINSGIYEDGILKIINSYDRDTEENREEEEEDDEEIEE